MGAKRPLRLVLLKFYRITLFIFKNISLSDAIERDIYEFNCSDFCLFLCLLWVLIFWSLLNIRLSKSKLYSFQDLSCERLWKIYLLFFLLHFRLILYLYTETYSGLYRASAAPESLKSMASKGFIDLNEKWQAPGMKKLSPLDYLLSTFLPL